MRRLTAPLSAVFLILVAGLAFTQLQARTEYPPPILDPEFGLWVSNPDLGGNKPMLWELEYGKGYGDQVLLQETTMADKKALEIQIFQDGMDERWAYARLGQTIDGTRLRALLDEKIGIWIFLGASCACNSITPNERGVFGVEINDGTHIVDFLFGQAAVAERSQSPTHRTILLQTSSGNWVHHPIDIIGQYHDAQWKLPEHISLSIIFGAESLATGRHAGYVHGFTVEKDMTSSTQQPPGLSVPLATNQRMHHASDQWMTPQQAHQPWQNAPAESKWGRHNGLIVDCVE